MRLLPALLLVLGAHYLLTLYLGTSLHVENRSDLFALTFTANYQHSLGITPPWDLNIIWSLAVEVQFYLVWPFMLWAIYRWGRTVRRMAFAMVAIIVAASITRAVEFQRWGWEAVYYRFEGRIDAFVIGGLLSLFWFHDRLPRRIIPWATLVGWVVLITVLWTGRFPQHYLYQWGYLGLNLAGGAVVRGLPVQRRHLGPHPVGPLPAPGRAGVVLVLPGAHAGLLLGHHAAAVVAHLAADRGGPDGVRRARVDLLPRSRAPAARPPADAQVAQVDPRRHGPDPDPLSRLRLTVPLVSGGNRRALARRFPPKRGVAAGEVQGVVEVGAEAAAGGLERDRLRAGDQRHGRDRRPGTEQHGVAPQHLGAAGGGVERHGELAGSHVARPGHRVARPLEVGGRPTEGEHHAPVAVVGGPQHQRGGAGDALHPQQGHVGARAGAGRGGDERFADQRLAVDDRPGRPDPPVDARGSRRAPQACQWAALWRRLVSRTTHGGAAEPCSARATATCTHDQVRASVKGWVRPWSYR